MAADTEHPGTLTGPLSDEPEFADTPQQLHGMKGVDAIPRWITVNQRLTAHVRSVIEARGWNESLKDEIEDYFSDLVELAHSTPPLQEMPTL